MTGFDAGTCPQFCRMRRALSNPRALRQGPDGASRHSNKTHHNKGLNPCQPGFVTIQDSLYWHSLVQAAGHGSSLAMQDLRPIAWGRHSSLPAMLAHIHLRLRYGAATRLLGAAVATVGISAGKVEMRVFMCTSMGSAMEVITDNILCNKTLHCQDNASRFICYALEN